MGERSQYPATSEEWLKTPLGTSLLQQESRLIEEAMDGIFGEECLQIGTWGEATTFVRHSRTHRSAVLAAPGDGASIIGEPHRLPIATDSIDSVLLPHTLDYTDRPHAVLREIHRVLRSDGHLLLTGFRPGGFWGLRRLVPGAEWPPGAHDLVSDRTLRDWLKLLDMRIHGVTRYFFRWPIPGVMSQSGKWEARGQRFWPELSACYLLSAQKRVSTLTPVKPKWRKKAKVVAGLAEPSTRISRIRFDENS